MRKSRLRLGRKLLLQLGLGSEQEQRPGQRIGGGLMPGKIKGRGIVDAERPRFGFGEALTEGVDHAGQEIAFDAPMPAVVDHLLQRATKKDLPPFSRPSFRSYRELRQA